MQMAGFACLGDHDLQTLQALSYKVNHLLSLFRQLHGIWETDFHIKRSMYTMYTQGGVIFYIIHLLFPHLRVILVALKNHTFL